MKRVLITGASSYLGGQIAAFLTQNGMEAELLSVRGRLPDSAFHGYDCVVHTAGLAHQRETEENAAKYDLVNRELAVKVALAAKEQGVKQFVFFSSMSVYGLFCGSITAQTRPAPNTAYGTSKLNAERELAALEDDSFRIAVLRPPMVYGKGCKGNYPRLVKLILTLPVFPKVRSKRSMLHIDVLCAFVERLISSGQGGLYFPQNREYVSMDALVSEVAKAHRRRVCQIPGFGWLLRLLAPHISTIGKLFGDLTYDQAMSEAFSDGPQPSFAETIARTEEA
ncbi:MAG: NAD-dependent epimerase/dehydratase family protein [Eubacteriales bacterium]|nr:NAD-dependent epimerase/dehydratase family protein [Eubacteriales bacterium]